MHIAPKSADPNYQCDIDLKTDEVSVYSCPKCLVTLNGDDSCMLCNAPMAHFLNETGSKVQSCTRNGCKNHTVEFEDLPPAP
ncbi:MAG: hypothetical protein NTW49_14710 [Bacteroidia bacterium]|nr:hypothetical protein [Bacteroidia bacterium]